tara:strand:- start:13622 stop:14968 length:1347 start_codon:yes stop_codon:yes gene_type:complete
MISVIKNYSINTNRLVNIIFAIFPLSFLFGSSIVNFNLLLFCFIGIYLLKSKIFTTKLYFPIKIIFLFFLLILFSTAISFIKSLYFNGFEDSELSRLIKSILFFRYFLFLIIVFLLNEHGILDFKYFFYSAAFFSFALSLDVIFQYIFGFNIVGLKSDWVFNSSFFGEEKIAGGNIVRFSFFTLFLSLFLLNKKSNIKFILATTIICILGVGIFTSGNRMPLVLFLLGLFFIFILDIKIKKIIFFSSLSLILIFLFISSFDDKIRGNYYNLYYFGEEILLGIGKISENKKKKYEDIPKDELILVRSGHKGLFSTAVETWRLNKIFGNGIKSFRIDCKKIIKVKIYSLCSNHPHNYYLEILTETGILGLLLIGSIMFLFLFLIFKNFKFFNTHGLENFVLLAAMTSLLIEMFPIRSSGSFFTTNNATYTILILSIFLCLINKIDKINSK